VKDLKALATASAVRLLTLRSVRLGDAAPIVALTELRRLELRLGSIDTLAPLTALRRLEYLEVWRVRGVADVDVAATLPKLKVLFLQDLPNITTLPNLSAATHLTAVHFEHLRGLLDLTGLAQAPAVTKISLVAFGHLSPDDLAPLRTLKTLRTVNIGLGSDRKNRAAAAVVQIPGNYGGWTLSVTDSGLQLTDYPRPRPREQPNPWGPVE
jgi:hypothetical protein